MKQARHAMLLGAVVLSMASAHPTLHLAGDSTMADRADLSHPERGWGQLLGEFVVPPARVVNHAANGRSTKSFIAEGRWQTLVDQLVTGDWVIVQFAHNDEKSEDPLRFAAADGDYAQNLTRMVRDVRSLGGIAILATPVVRRHWNDAGELLDTHGDYPEAVRRVARKEGVPWLELHDLTRERVELLGPEASKALYLWSAEHDLEDNTHFSERGAREVAAMAAKEIARWQLPLRQHLRFDSLAAPPPAWSADRGDGTYRNPVLFADYSDPDVVRVGDDYYLTASSFSHVPGLPILQSKDLVNWQLINHALPTLGYAGDTFSRPQHGNGVWAPAIRYRDGRYMIYWGDPDFGIYRVTTNDPAGKWGDPEQVLAGKGLIDPCPFWDEDGRAWLVHAWARSRSGINNILTLRELSPDGRRVIDEAGRTIIDGNALPGYRTLEGPKVYRRGGVYWILAPAGGVEHGWQSAFRAQRIEGPYEERIVLDQGRTSVNGPHQGAWIDTPSGENWFVHFQDRGPYGRITHLQPMSWSGDGWPIMGEDPDGNGRGEPVLTHRKPVGPGQPGAVPATSDEFDDAVLGRQWQWQCNPQAAWARLEDGQLRLQHVPLPETGANLWSAGALLMQKPPAPAFVARTELVTGETEPGGRAGLVVFGSDYAWIGLQRRADAWELVVATCPAADHGGSESVVARAAVQAGPVSLELRWQEGGRCTFAASQNGQQVPLPETSFQAQPGRWVGARVGLFASAPAGVGPPTHAGFNWFRLSP